MTQHALLAFIIENRCLEHVWQDEKNEKHYITEFSDRFDIRFQDPLSGSGFIPSTRGVMTALSGQSETFTIRPACFVVTLPEIPGLRSNDAERNNP